MRLPDLSDTQRMAKIGRLSVLKSERRKCAEKLRDSLIPIINNTGTELNISEAKKTLADIEHIDTLIQEESK